MEPALRPIAFAVAWLVALSLWNSANVWRAQRGGVRTNRFNTSTTNATQTLWLPPNTTAAPRPIVLIVPLRDRESQWAEMRRHMCGFWRPEWPPLEIWAVRQEEVTTLSFNRGWLFNAGLRLLDSDARCVALHDVDLLPLDGVDYTACEERPVHLSSEAENHNWGSPYAHFSGGVFLASPAHWWRINGLSNEFWGWGGEDDEMFFRWRREGLTNGGAPHHPIAGRGRFRKNRVEHTQRKRDEREYSHNVRLMNEMEAGVRSPDRDGVRQTLFAVRGRSAYRECARVQIREANVSQPVWVGAELAGRLGNQLFIAAASHGIARRRGAEWCIQGGDWAEHVVFTDEPPPAPCPSTGAASLDEGGRYAAYVPELETAHPGRSVTLRGYLQSHRYFANATAPFRLRSMDRARAWVQQRGITVGVHVRRGDYLTDANHVGKTPPLDYYARALRLLGVVVDDPSTLLVCSDDPDWVDQQPLFRGAHVSRGRSPGDDMALLAACPGGLVIGAGTFGWWAAFFSKARVVYYLNADDADVAGGRMVPADHFPEGWVALGDDL